ncbi:hypothetical protein ABV409_13270 [Flagellimonas sp. DF-77]|uniref:hypothetical protein n=1 Tax=Flagellimonas algarum TaxID=3230298 RepID=UPI00339852AE
MKRIIKNILGFASLASVLMFTACEDGDTVFDTIIDAEQRGAILRTVNLISNELPIGVADAGFSVEVEVQDQANGNNVNNIEVFVGYRDNTVAEGGTDLDVAESLFTTIPSSEFTIGEFGLPRTSFAVTLVEMLSFTGVSEDDLFGGDQFTVRFELVLNDGRRFSFADNSGTLTGSFFSSPFLYTPTVVCPVGAEQFVGDYVVNQVVPGIFSSNTWGDGTTVTLAIGETSTQRVFEAVYLPDFGIGNGPRAFAFDLVCESVNPIASQASGLQCSGGITLGPPIDAAPGTYDPFDDSVFNIVLRDDESDDCGGGVDAEVTLTKV